MSKIEGYNENVWFGVPMSSAIPHAEASKPSELRLLYVIGKKRGSASFWQVADVILRQMNTLRKGRADRKRAK